MDHLVDDLIDELSWSKKTRSQDGLEITSLADVSFQPQILTDGCELGLPHLTNQRLWATTMNIYFRTIESILSI